MRTSVCVSEIPASVRIFCPGLMASSSQELPLGEKATLYRFIALTATVRNEIRDE